MSRKVAPVVTIETLPFARDMRYRLRAKVGNAHAWVDLGEGHLRVIADLASKIQGDHHGRGLEGFMRCKRAILSVFGAMGVDGFSIREERKP